MAAEDIRWTQRLNNYQNALAVLERTAARFAGRAPDETEQLALIQCFEFTHELAWNLLKDVLEFDGVATSGSRSATRAAVARGLIADAETWMEMVDSRNLTSHTYSERTAAAVAGDVSGRYLPLFRQLRDKLAERQAGDP